MIIIIIVIIIMIIEQMEPTAAPSPFLQVIVYSFLSFALNHNDFKRSKIHISLKC